MPITWGNSFWSGAHSVAGANRNSAYPLDKKSVACYTISVPIYEYECSECGHRVEVLQKVSDSPLTKCQKCEGKVERLVSSPAIQFKGTGWYVTDYARKGQTQSSSDRSTSTETVSTSKTSRSKDSGPAVSASSTSKD